MASYEGLLDSAEKMDDVVDEAMDEIKVILDKDPVVLADINAQMARISIARETCEAEGFNGIGDFIEGRNLLIEETLGKLSPIPFTSSNHKTECICGAPRC